MIYFVTETFLKAKTPITQNVDVNEITPFIETNADMRIQPILETDRDWETGVLAFKNVSVTK